MKSLKTIAAYSLLILFLLYGMNNFVFERKFYFNEILSFSGFLIFLLKSFKKTGKFLIPKEKIYRLVLFLLCIGFIHLIISIKTKTNFYFYLRNSVLIYSIFTFFIGFYLYNYQISFFKKIRKFLLTFFILTIPTQLIFLLDRYSSLYFLPFSFRKIKIISLSLFLILGCLYGISVDALTNTIVVIVVVFILLIRTYKQFVALSTFTFILLISVFLYLKPSLEKYQLSQNGIFGNYTEVYQHNPILQIDYNSSWRAVLWYRAVVERFPENLIGIGLGTSILPYKTHTSDPQAQQLEIYDAHVNGLHNTFLTVLVRFGLPFLLLLILIYQYIFKEFYRYKKYYNGKDHYLFMGFFIISGIGFFNLTLESPTMASLYWISLGFISRAIMNRRSIINKAYKA